MYRSTHLQNEETQPSNVGPLSPSSTLGRNEDAHMHALPLNLPDLSPTCIETIDIPEEQEFDVDFIDSQENLYNARVTTSESEDDSVGKSGEEGSEYDKGGGGLEDMVWPPEMLGAT